MNRMRILPEGFGWKVLAAMAAAVAGNILVQYVIPWPDFMERPDAVQIPIFAMTANAFSDDRKRCKEAGMTEHLAKPLNSEKMIAKLRLYYNRKV